jgi:hypothetical protein
MFVVKTICQLFTAHVSTCSISLDDGNSSSENINTKVTDQNLTINNLYVINANINTFVNRTVPWNLNTRVS